IGRRSIEPDELPGKVLVRSGQETIEPEIWWMLFNGPSRKRRELEHGSSGDAAALEIPPLEAGISYKQWALHAVFLIAAILIGFELASTDALRALEMPDQIPKARTAPPKARTR